MCDYRFASSIRTTQRGSGEASCAHHRIERQQIIGVIAVAVSERVAQIDYDQKSSEVVAAQNYSGSVIKVD